MTSGALIRPDGSLAGRPQLMRTMNEQLLLEELRRAAPVSRPDLARLTGLSKPTVAQSLAGLERDGLIRAAGRRTGVRGPSAVLYELRPDAGFVLGLDVGRVYLRGALVDLGGTVRAKRTRRVPTASGRGRVGELAALADDLLREAGLRRSSLLLQTVVGSPGVVDPTRGALRMAANFPGWEQPEVLSELRRLCGASTVVENDIDVAALAERDHGHGRDASTFAFVSVGTGIGMGLVIDGKLHRGAHGAAGEIAYLPLTARGADADEVRHRGALEASVSASAVVRAARARGLDGNLTARKVFAAAAAGDARARAIVATEAQLVAKAIASIIAIVDPELVVLGGGIGSAPEFAVEVSGRLERLAPFVPEIRVSALGEDAVVDGAVSAGLELVWEQLLRSREPELAPPRR